MRVVQSLQTRIPPPLVMLTCAGIGWAFDRIWPGAAFALPARGAWAIAFLVCGLAVAAAGVAAFRRARTTVNPLRPAEASSLVTSGVYRFTRNPMYVGLLSVLLAWTLWLANAASALALPLFILYMNRFQIEPEERAMRALFGEAFGAYAARVRRWL
jgi:protein-S-isoprenylcysteine O-methyltransferase Ste14